MFNKKPLRVAIIPAVPSERPDARSVNIIRKINGVGMTHLSGMAEVQIGM